ncbi:hypothetical protein GCM10008098_30610 [Rhodanobacter panaciterrae]|uniref:Uncharacterized protein n=1 Tax=Rhodanobacter panaciterrae TaxID=490572 RepID=A0ABQ3A8B9_9GAMM|nr:hypothetical protein [Rhodanobacter panaciterrae]GGY35385.1 hypothetical protein GCM10008098_30610 [Rhodanobacter panaciterrae]
MEAQTLLALPIVLALEPVAGEAPARMTLSRDEAAELAELIAVDLHTLVPQVSEARLALAGALFDQVELLRPGFPVWATLDELARRVPRGQLDNVVAFGSHDGHMPAQPLEPSPIFADGPMRLLPLSLLAPAALAEELSELLEIHLVGRGEAGTLTADWLMRTLGIRLEHVRYLSRNDLLALTCVQYEHVNLAPLWTLLEAALLAPQRAESSMSARGLSLHYADGKVLTQSPAQWLAAQTGDVTQRAHAFAGIVFELRQYAALLDAHQLPLRLQSAAQTEAEAGYLLETVAAVAPGYEPPALFAHEAPGLGVVAITVAQRGEGGTARALAHGYPLQPQALGPLLARLADRYGIAAELHALGRVMLDDRGQLSAPVTALH